MISQMEFAGLLPYFTLLHSEIRHYSVGFLSLHSDPRLPILGGIFMHSVLWRYHVSRRAYTSWSLTPVTPHKNNSQTRVETSHVNHKHHIMLVFRIMWWIQQMPTPARKQSHLVIDVCNIFKKLTEIIFIQSGWGKIRAASRWCICKDWPLAIRFFGL